MHIFLQSSPSTTSLQRRYYGVSLRPSLPVSLQDTTLRHPYRGISMVVSLQSSLFVSLRSEFLQPSLLMFLRNEFLQPFLLTSLISILLWHLYRSISMVLSIQEKPETPTFKFLLRESLPISLLLFYKQQAYNVIDWITTQGSCDNNISFQCTSIGKKMMRKISCIFD